MTGPTMTAKPTVVVTNPVFAETHALLAQHATVEANTAIEPWSHDEVRERCAGAAALLAFMTDRLDAAFFAACPHLQVVGAALKGADNIDVEAATEAGVWVTIVPDLLTVPTAELAIGLILALGRNIVAGDGLIRTSGFRGWRAQLYGAGLSGATVGIIGTGLVGCAIAERLAGFGCRLLAYDETPSPALRAAVPAVTITDLDTVLAQSDHVVLALPLTPRTQHIIDAAAIARMKPGARLINPARGSLVDEAAVADAIERGHLAGYAADVFECEDWARAGRPADIDPRLTAPGAPTVLTPHVGSGIVSARRAIERAAAGSILDALAGRVPQGAINSPRRSVHAQSSAR